mgnify:CR=1 FL=1
MQSSFSDLEYAAKKKVTRRERFLNELDVMAPWAALCAEIEPYYPRGKGRGRPPIGLERMLRMYLTQHCFGLSDEATEDALYDSQAIRQFVGLDLGRESAPDATTLLKFRHLLEAQHATPVAPMACQNAGRADIGVAGEGQFHLRGEDADTVVGTGFRRQEEHRLGQVQPGGDGLHGGIVQAIGVEHHGQRVAGTGARGEDVQLQEAAGGHAVFPL